MWKVLVGIVVTTAVITASVVLYRHRHRLFRPDVGRAGGTRLVVACGGKAGADQVAAALARRFDPTGALGIEVRTSGDEIEIDVPNGRHHDDQVERVKRLLGRSGRLRFGILAHADDDGPAIAAARKWLTPANGKALEDARDKGAALPPVRSAAGEDRFPDKRPGEPPNRYSWVHLGPSSASRFVGTGFHAVMGMRAGWPVAHEAARAGRGGAITFVLLREPGDGEGASNAHVAQVRVIEIGRGPHATRLQLRLSGEGRAALNDYLARHLRGSRQVALALDDEVLMYFDAASELVHTTFEPVIDSREEGEDRMALVRGPLPEGAALSLREERPLSPRR